MTEEQTGHAGTRATLREVQAELDLAHEFNGRLSREHADELERQKNEVSCELPCHLGTLQMALTSFCLPMIT